LPRFRRFSVRQQKPDRQRDDQKPELPEALSFEQQQRYWLPTSQWYYMLPGRTFAFEQAKRQNQH